MKTLIMLLLAVTCVERANAQDREKSRMDVFEYEKVKVQKAKDLRNSQIKFSECARRLIEVSGGGLQGFNKVITFFEETQTKAAYRPVEYFKERTTACFALREQLNTTASTRANKLKFLRKNETRLDPKVYAVLQNILYPEVKCGKGGLSLTAGIYFSFDVHLEGAICKSTTGRRWFELRGGGGGGNESIGIALTGFGGSDNRNSTSKVAPIAGQTYGQGYRALAIAYTEFQSEPDVEDAERVHDTGWGLGVGIGYLHTNGGMGAIKMIPLGTDDDRLLATILYLY